MKLDNPLPSSAGYPLYAALLARCPADFGNFVHSCQTSPVSQYVVGDAWYISVFGEDSRQVMDPILESLHTLTLCKLDKTVHIIDRTIQTVESVDDLFLAEAPEKLLFRTPTAFKSNGVYQLLPTQHFLIQSLIQKWNSCFFESCPIEDVTQVVGALSEGFLYRGICLESTGYPIKNTVIPGTLGSIRVKLPEEDDRRKRICALLRLGSFTGAGIKTALGMGGFAVE